MRIDRDCIGFALFVALAISAAPGAGWASSHREAPAIAMDPMADNTDVYAFISPNNPDNLVLIANYVPLLLPASGPNFYGFADDVRYEICLDNDGDAMRDLCYRWRFNTEIQNGATFLYNTGPVDSLTDPDLNVRQTLDLSKVVISGPNETEISVIQDAPVAPWNAGKNGFPDYFAVAAQAISTVGDMKIFAGPRDEPFFVDLHIFDLLGMGGASTTDGLNVMSLVLEVPIEEIAAGGVRPSVDESGPTSVIGVYARALRRRISILRRTKERLDIGGHVQVSRLAWPLINEVVVPLADKDKYNRSDPYEDLANIGGYILDPRLAGLIPQFLGITCPPTPPGGRLDIVGLLSPNSTFPADLLRIDIRQGQSFANSAFPNGRTLEDDVVDTLLTVICNSGQSLGDGVSGNDLPFSSAFPYLASPHSGNP